MGDTDKIDLQAALEHAGWHVERHEGDEWWVRESWELTSTWRPVGARAYVTLLVDPMSETGDIHAVWAIGVTRDKPPSWSKAVSSGVRVRPRWPERIKEVVEMAGALRPTA